MFLNDALRTKLYLTAWKKCFIFSPFLCNFEKKNGIRDLLKMLMSIYVFGVNRRKEGRLREVISS